MGIGRFAFTPLLPMMLADGVVDLAAGTWLATANYLGYWVGALACTLQPWLWSRLGIGAPRHTSVVRFGLVSTVLLTLAMAPVAGRLAAVALPGRRGQRPGLRLHGGLVPGAPDHPGGAGPGRPDLRGAGLGIAVSGLAATAMVAGGWSAAAGWLAFGLLAALLSGAGLAAAARRGARRPTRHSEAPERPRACWRCSCWSTAWPGFGYIVTATFLPVIARQALPGSVWLDLFWPLFGGAWPSAR
jgi:hypothetical protein